MDPVTLIVGALAAGALKGVGDAASTAVQDAYARLKALVSVRLAGSPSAVTALREHQLDPEANDAVLASHVRERGLGQDESVIAAAQQLMALLDTVGSRNGKYVVDLRGAQGIQVGDHNRQENTFGAPPSG
jgi:hypothetical protein